MRRRLYSKLSGICVPADAVAVAACRGLTRRICWFLSPLHNIGGGVEDEAIGGCIKFYWSFKENTYCMTCMWHLYGRKGPSDGPLRCPLYVCVRQCVRRTVLSDASTDCPPDRSDQSVGPVRRTVRQTVGGTMSSRERVTWSIELNMIMADCATLLGAVAAAAYNYSC